MKRSYQSTTAIIKRYFHTAYRIFIQPRSADPEIKRQEFVLNIILSGIIVLITWSEGYVMVTSFNDKGDYRGIPILFFTILTVLFISLLVLSRRGHPRVASYALITLFFAGATYGAFMWGPDLQPVLISYILIIFMAGILINGLTGFITTAVISSVIIFFAHLQLVGVLKPELYWKHEDIEVFDMVEIAFMLFVITCVSWLSNHEHERSL